MMVILETYLRMVILETYLKDGYSRNVPKDGYSRNIYIVICSSIGGVPGENHRPVVSH
jgi:hypothetical protein